MGIVLAPSTGSTMAQIDTDGSAVIVTSVTGSFLTLGLEPTQADHLQDHELAFAFGRAAGFTRWLGYRWTGTGTSRSLELFDPWRYRSGDAIVRVTDRGAGALLEDAGRACRVAGWDGVAYLIWDHDPHAKELAPWAVTSLTPQCSSELPDERNVAVVPFVLIDLGPTGDTF